MNATRIITCKHKNKIQTHACNCHYFGTCLTWLPWNLSNLFTFDSDQIFLALVCRWLLYTWTVRLVYTIFYSLRVCHFRKMVYKLNFRAVRLSRHGSAKSFCPIKAYIKSLSIQCCDMYFSTLHSKFEQVSWHICQRAVWFLCFYSFAFGRGLDISHLKKKSF